jgi:intein-encoded DNA endonuclease-like protein
MMKGDATAFDPKMEFDIELDTSEIAGLEIMLRSVEGSTDASKTHSLHSPFDVFFATEDAPEYSESKKLAKMSHDRNGASIMIANTVPTWKGKVTKIRIDPTNSVGSFELEYIKILAWDKKKICTYIDGKEYSAHYPSKFEDGEWYVPFEVQCNFHLMTNLYYEWDNDEKTLMVECDGKVSYWKENSDIVKIDGKEVKLAKPLEFYDNLPYMPMTQLCEALGCSYTAEDNKLYITTK